MPMTVVKVTSSWNRDKTALTVHYRHIVRLKNRIAKKWLSRGLAVTLEEADFVNGKSVDSIDEESGNGGS
jgi:hypothetical protein